MTTPITKEQLIDQAKKNIEVLRGAAERIPGASDAAVIHLKLAEIALAAMDAEPVYQWRERYEEGSLWEDCTKEQYDGFAKDPECEARILYTAPPAPVVPDERYQHLSDLYHVQEKRLFKLAQRIKGPSFDKYAYSPSQAIDVLESAIFGDTSDASAAMLNHQSSNQASVEAVPGDEIKQRASNSVNEPVSQCDELPYDPQIAEYEKIMQQAIPDGYVLVPVEPTENMLDAAYSFPASTEDRMRKQYVAMLEAAPQQEGK